MTRTSPEGPQTSVSEGRTRDYEHDDAPPPRLPAAPAGYDLLRPLGIGGMGAVYLAFDRASERHVAMKFMHSPSNSRLFERFLTEIRALGRLDHPNIVKVFAVETDCREPFFTMELVDGGTLSDLAKSETPPTPLEAARIMLPIAEAMEAAHRAGVLHRDLKPRNILISRPGSSGSGSTKIVPKISDFGLAKRVDRGQSLTSTGPIGTPAYMSPEAAAGRLAEIGPAADVYGLGATLYHLLTGLPPFQGETTDKVLQRVINEMPTRPRVLRPEIPMELEAIVMKAMEKPIGDRYATSAEFAADLQLYLGGKPPKARVWSWQWRARLWLLRNQAYCYGALLALVVAGGLVALGRELVDPRPSDPVVVDPAAEHLAALKKDLREGRPVTLIGATGKPGWHKWQLGGAEFGKSPTSDDTCYYESVGLSLLELLDTPGISRYTIRVQLRQVQRPASPAGAEPNDDGNCGLYFGHAFVPGKDGFAADCCFAFTFRDFDPTAVRTGVAQKQFANFSKLIIGHRPPDNVERLPASIVSVKFDPARARPGYWRTLEVEVEPTVLRIRWQALDDRPIENVQRPNGRPLVPAEIYESMQTRLNEPPYDDKEIRIPEWSPEMPIGIYAMGCAITIKNLTIQPK